MDWRNKAAPSKGSRRRGKGPQADGSGGEREPKKGGTEPRKSNSKKVELGSRRYGGNGGTAQIESDCRSHKNATELKKLFVLRDGKGRENRRRT